MKRILTAVFALLAYITVFAQTDSERYAQRYDLLVSKLGPAGLGVETILNNWEKADSTDARMLLGKFSYLFTKAQTSEVVSRSSKRYLGMEPILSLKDSLGNDIYYYQENIFDDELYGQAIKAADKAIQYWPDRLDFRFMKANAYIAYEKESPDLALAYLQDLISENISRQRPWEYDGTEAGKGFFEEAMQEYCFSFYSIGSVRSRDAFLNLSLLLSETFPDNLQYVNNIGSYYLVKEDYKTALKHYAKVLKKDPKDYTAIKNSALSARKMKNAKLEMKYLQMLVKYGPEGDALAAKARLEALNR